MSGWGGGISSKSRMAAMGSQGEMARPCLVGWFGEKKEWKRREKQKEMNEMKRENPASPHPTPRIRKVRTHQRGQLRIKMNNENV